MLRTGAAEAKCLSMLYRTARLRGRRKAGGARARRDAVLQREDAIRARRAPPRVQCQALLDMHATLVSSQHFGHEAMQTTSSRKPGSYQLRTWSPSRHKKV